MRKVKVINKTRDGVLGSRVVIADRWWSRMRGFVGRPAPGAGEGILLSPCRAVHMIGVSFPLDIVFIDRRGGVVSIYSSLAPGRRTAFHRSAEYALEVPAGTIDATHTREGDLLAWLPAEMPGRNGTKTTVERPVVRQSTVDSEQKLKVESQKSKVESGQSTFDFERSTFDRGAGVGEG
jgi:uncharacterized membrane protein (UPF0127 family)